MFLNKSTAYYLFTKKSAASTFILFVFSTLIVLITFLALFASPVSDDYCFAYASRNFGLVNSFEYFLSSWSPSLTYLWLLLPWKLNLSLVQVSTVFCLTTTILSGVVLTSAIKKSIEYPRDKTRSVLIQLLVIGLIGSLALVQSTVLFTSKSAKSLEVFGVIRDWAQANIIGERDGALLRWAVSTPLTSNKLLFSCCLLLLASTIAQKLFQNNRRGLHLILLLAMLLSFLLGASHESITAMGLVFCVICFEFIKGRDRIKNALLVFVLLFVVSSYLLAPGSQSRQENLFQKDLMGYISIFLGILWQFTWMTAMIYLLAKVISMMYKLIINNDPSMFSKNTRKVFRTLFAVSLIVQVSLETLIYPAIYHWISYCLISFFYFFLEIVDRQPNALPSRRGKLFPQLVFVITSCILIASMFSTVFSAQERFLKISEREKSSVDQGSNAIINAPLLDNAGNLYAQDLDADFGSIVPFEGFVPQASLYCYKKLQFE
jgi:hypothetical protein